jgi:hypothetical protein
MLPPVTVEQLEKTKHAESVQNKTTVGTTYAWSIGAAASVQGAEDTAAASNDADVLPDTPLHSSGPERDATRPMAAYGTTLQDLDGSSAVSCGPLNNVSKGKIANGVAVVGTAALKDTNGDAKTNVHVEDHAHGASIDIDVEEDESAFSDRSEFGARQFSSAGLPALQL